MERLTRVFLFLAALMAFSSCSNEIDGDKAYYLKLSIDGIPFQGGGKAGYKAYAPGDGVSFTFHVDDPKKKVNTKWDGISSIESGVIMYFPQAPMTFGQWDWGTVELIDAQSMVYRATIDANHSQYQRKVVIEIGHYPDYNVLTVIQNLWSEEDDIM